MEQSVAPIIVSGIRHTYRDTLALDRIDLSVPAGKITGLIGPDGVGKSTLLSLIAGAIKIQEGDIEVFGGDITDHHYRSRIAPRIAFMPQGLGKNLYATLSVNENIDFFGRLFSISGQQRQKQINELLDATGLTPFRDRPAGKLSGGMKQKLGLCCALIHDPDLLILDEPTTGVDPLSRRQFWELVDRIRVRRPDMTVIIATAYMDEAEGFDWLVPMNNGQILTRGTAAELKQLTATNDLESAFIALLPEHIRNKHQKVSIPELQAQEGRDVAISAQGLTKRFGDFTAVDHVDLDIHRGEIFGFLGSNGCGKTTTMKMLTGLLPATEGQAELFGSTVDAQSMQVRKRVGYMSQSFSLYEELTVIQNLRLHARLYGIPPERVKDRTAQLIELFDLHSFSNEISSALPLGIRQRLSLAVAVVHEPELLILDEPTSGVDPIARDTFWSLLIDLSRSQGVTIFISTHFMNEAQRCDCISLMHSGKVLVSDTPQAIMASRNSETLEDAFINYLKDEEKEQETEPDGTELVMKTTKIQTHQMFSFRRLFGYSIRESLEVVRDPIRLTFALIGSALLMTVLGFGISMDVEDLRFAVLDRDQSPLSRDYIQNIAGSRYFIEQPPLHDLRELDQRMKSGELSLAIEIPPGFSTALKRGRDAEIALWIDGAMPFIASTISGYAQGMHAEYMVELAMRSSGDNVSIMPANLESRYRYNQDFKSIYAMVPTVIPLLLMFIPAILTALSVVREKELGSIVNLYVSPANRLEFLLGKQIPYIIISMLSFAILTISAVFLFQVPLKGELSALALAAFLYVTISTGIGLFMSAFTRTQIAALAATAIVTMLATVSFSGLQDPVSSLEGIGRVIGENWPATYFITVVRGVFTKGLGFSDLIPEFQHLLIFPLIITVLSVFLLRRQGQ